MKPKQTGIQIHSLSRAWTKKNKQRSNKRIRQTEREDHESTDLRSSK
jgi:hypothetical protein